MRCKIVLDGKELTYILRKRQKSKRLSLTVNCDAEVVATIPNFFPLYSLEKFIREQAGWLFEKIEWRKKNNSNLPKNSYKNFLLYKSAALKLIRRKLEEFNKIYNFKYTKICIRNQKTRWGSCSSKGTLSFSYRIALIPEELANYIVVHELCHLKEMNHSSNFWMLVEKTVPNYKKLRQTLKQIPN